MSRDNLLAANNAVMKVLGSSPLLKDQIFKSCVEQSDVEGAVARSKELAQSDKEPLNIRMVAELIPGSVERLRSLVATASEDVAVTRAQHRLS